MKRISVICLLASLMLIMFGCTSVNKQESTQQDVFKHLRMLGSEPLLYFAVESSAFGLFYPGVNDPRIINTFNFKKAEGKEFAHLVIVRDFEGDLRLVALNDRIPPNIAGSVKLKNLEK